MLEPDIPRVPDDWTVWAVSDVHGVTSGLTKALRQAGVIDDDSAWIAPPKTALIGCGDYIDRGKDSPGVIALLQRLADEAADRGGAVITARGNHEVMPLMVRDGFHEAYPTWLKYGGVATMRSFGCEPIPVDEATRWHGLMERCAPGLFTWLERLPEAVRWRDVLFVHGGLPPGRNLADLGVRTDEHLWIREEFYDAPWDADAFAAYRRDGVDRVVFGHTPQPIGRALFHAGRSYNIDSNAVGDPRMPEGAPQELTLLGLRGDVSFEAARIISVPTFGAPDAMNGRH